MEHGETMIAIGIGCRRGAPQAEIAAMIKEALAKAQIGGEPMRLFTIDAKRDEAGLVGAADALGLPLEFFSVEALRSVEGKIATPSSQAAARFGVASISEAAALTGAGQDAYLIAPRVAGSSVTIAIARGSGR
jgi:cobalamin biosynthesis protein CbiG